MAGHHPLACAQGHRDVRSHSAGRGGSSRDPRQRYGCGAVPARCLELHRAENTPPLRPAAALGPKIVAKAWLDPVFKAALLADAQSALKRCVWRPGAAFSARLGLTRVGGGGHGWADDGYRCCWLWWALVCWCTCVWVVGVGGLHPLRGFSLFPSRVLPWSADCKAIQLLLLQQQGAHRFTCVLLPLQLHGH